MYADYRNYIVLGCVALLAGAGLFVYEVWLPHTSFIEPRELKVTQGMGSRAIGALLREEGIIRSKWAFVFYVSLRGEVTSLKPGRYMFFNSAAISDIARDLVAGASRERIVVIPEGWNTIDIARYLGKQGIGDEAEVLRICAAPRLEWTARFAFLADRPQGAGLEGYLFPDTYRVFADALPEDVVEKMLDNFDKKVSSDLRAEIARQKNMLFAVITMASLIEREVVSDEDRAIVSGILWKRMDAGIPLQVDATIAYAKTQLGNGVSKLGNATEQNEKISIVDTKINSPYNTYKYRGLPPGPIANPGLSAIRAAIYPKPSPHLYYLSAPDGRTIFSKTLDEHNAAKARYLR